MARRPLIHRIALTALATVGALTLIVLGACTSALLIFSLSLLNSTAR